MRPSLNTSLNFRKIFETGPSKLRTPHKYDWKRVRNIDSKSEDSKVKRVPNRSGFAEKTGLLGTRRFLTGPRLQPMFDPGAVVIR
jgi:hypothetical protein